VRIGGAFLAGTVVAVLVAAAVLELADLEIVEDQGNSNLVSVPVVTGMTTWEAMQEIRRATLEARLQPPQGPLYYKPKRPRRLAKGNMLEAEVFWQNPYPGTEIEAGGAVTITMDVR
jgi:beta-lactam-binding protein with PASTA domain